MDLCPHIGFWAEAGVPLAAELMGGTEDPAATPSTCWIGPSRPSRLVWGRTDAAGTPVTSPQSSPPHVWNAGMEFAIGAKRTSKVMAAARGPGRYTWVPAVGMEDTEAAIIEYLPGAGPWPQEANIACIARRTRIPSDTDSHRPGPKAPHHRQGPARPRPGNGRGRRTVARLRRELIRVPARLTHRAGEILLRLPPGPQQLATVLPQLQQLPAPG